MTKLLVIDTETGGPNPVQHSILSVGAVIWENGVKGAQTEIFIVETNQVTTPEALQYNKIDIAAHNKKAIAPADAVSSLMDFVKKNFADEISSNQKVALAGHNVAFDVGFLRRLFQLGGSNLDDVFSHRTLDTAGILRYLAMVGRVSPSATDSTGAFAYFEITIPAGKRHTALGDAEATADLLTKLMEILSAPPLPPTNTPTTNKVSRFFRLDWTYALRIAEIPSLVTVAQIVFSGGVLSQALPWSIASAPIALFWVASVLFVLGYVLMRVRAPLFIQEYRSFKDFADRNHSHRWILWEFYHGVRSIDGEQRKLLTETIQKAVAIHIDGPVSGDASDFITAADLATATPVLVKEPTIFNRDIFMPFVIDGQRYVLPMQEADTLLEKKQKELFWILHTYLTSSRKISRALVWLFFALAAVAVVMAAAFFAHDLFTQIQKPEVTYV